MKHIKGGWKVMPCPVNKGKHILHDNRYIVTSDAEVEYSKYVPNDWTLSKGSIICRLTDLPDQKSVACLIKTAPELLKAAQAVMDMYKDDSMFRHPRNCKAIKLMEQAINKAKGE